VVGLGVGAAAIVLFRALLRRKEPPLLPLGWLLLCGAVLILALHGTRWMIEPVVHRFAEALRLAVPGCR